jgi:hypothetical protein
MRFDVVPAAGVSWRSFKKTGPGKSGYGKLEFSPPVRVLVFFVLADCRGQAERTRVRFG